MSSDDELLMLIPRTPRHHGRWMLALGGVGFVCFYMAGAASMLRMVECPSFAFFAPNPFCRDAMYWSTAGELCFGGALAVGVSALVRRRYARALRLAGLKSRLSSGAHTDVSAHRR